MAMTEEREWTLESLLRATHKPDTVFGTIGYPSILGNLPVLVDGKLRYESDVIKIDTCHDPFSGKFTRITIVADKAGAGVEYPSKTIALQKGDYSSTKPISDRDITDLEQELEKRGIKLGRKAYNYFRHNQEQINDEMFGFFSGP